MSRRTRPAILFALAAAIAAALWALGLLPFGGAAPLPSAQDLARAEILRPDSPALAAIYERACLTCHATPDAQAPLTGFSPAWAARADERGAAGLLDSARYGFGAMPAMGLCNDCTDTEFRALIGFMSDGEVQP